MILFKDVGLDETGHSHDIHNHLTLPQCSYMMDQECQSLVLDTDTLHIQITHSINNIMPDMLEVHGQKATQGAHTEYTLNLKVKNAGNHVILSSPIWLILSFVIGKII